MLPLAGFLLVALVPFSNARSICDDLTSKVTNDVINSINWPKSAQIVATGKLSDTWDTKAKGEVAPNGVYNDAMGVLEYFYGLAGPLDPNPANNLDAQRVVSTEVVWITCNATTRTVAAETFIKFADGRGNPGIKIDIIHVYKFNKQRKICGYSLTSKRQEILIDSMPGAVDPAVVIPQVCGGVQFLCTGPNQQFANYTACATFMQSIPMGSSASLDQSNVLCRRLHLSLAGVDPKTHCPHVGPTGGGKCTNKGVESQFMVKEFMNC